MNSYIYNYRLYLICDVMEKFEATEAVEFMTKTVPSKLIISNAVSLSVKQLFYPLN